jgi:hypothetical protein
VTCRCHQAGADPRAGGLRCAHSQLCARNLAALHVHVVWTHIYTGLLVQITWVSQDGNQLRYRPVHPDADADHPARTADWLQHFQHG